MANAMPQKIMLALNQYENALRNAIRRDTIAEQQEVWDTVSLRMCDIAWKEYKEKRVELEAVILEMCQHK